MCGIQADWPTMIDRQTSNTTYIPICQGCLPFFELHSRSLSVGRTATGACDLKIAHMCFTQSRDCANVLRNLEIVHTCYTIPTLPAQSRDSKNVQRNLKIAQIPRLRGTDTHSPATIVGTHIQWINYE